MSVSIELLTKALSGSLPYAGEVVAVLHDWIVSVLKDKMLEKELVTQPASPDTQRKLKTIMAAIAEDESLRKELMEKLVSMNKAIADQSVDNRNATIDKQINIQQHTGDIHIHYDTKEEKKADQAVALFDIKMLVASGDTKQAIEQLLQQSKQNYSRLLNDSILVAGRFNGLNKQVDRSTISNENAGIEMARINQAILHYVEQMEAQKIS